MTRVQAAPLHIAICTSPNTCMAIFFPLIYYLNHIQLTLTYYAAPALAFFPDSLASLSSPLSCQCLT